jgi:uncharacterized protein YjbI with pentapeptide repeats
MTDPQLDVASLVSRIQQLEERQNSTAQYAVRVKRQLDELTEQFNDLQQRFSQLPTLSNSLNSLSSANLDEANLANANLYRTYLRSQEEAASRLSISRTKQRLILVVA